MPGCGPCSAYLPCRNTTLWPRLKACRNDICSVIFYDSSKNQSRVWCNTLVSGNRVNLQASRARRRHQNS